MSLEFGGSASGGDHQALLHASGDHVLRQSPTWGITFNAIVYMAAPMSMPATMASAGWIGGTIILFYSCIATYHSGEIIGRLCERFPEAHSYPKLLGEVVKKSLSSHFSSVQIDRFSELAVFGCHILQFLAYYFDTIAQMLYVAQYFDQLFPKSSVCQWSWLIIVYFLVVPLMLVPSFAESRWVSVPSLLSIIIMVVLFVMEILHTKPWDCNPGPIYDNPKPLNLFVSLSAFAYMFGGHGMFPEMIREMKKPKDFTKVLKWTYAVVMIQYIVCGYLGFYAYGSSVNANINLSWPYNQLNVASIIVQLVVCYYLVYLTNAVLMMNIEISFGLLPTSTRPHSKYKRFLFRILFLGTQIILAEFLLGGSGDVLLGLQSLAGAIGMSALTYFLPFIMFWSCFPKELSKNTKIIYIANIAIGVLIMCLGIISSLDTLIENSGGILSGYCHLEHTYNQTCTI